MDDDPQMDPLLSGDISIEKEVLSQGPYTIGSEVEYRVILTNSAEIASSELHLIDEEVPDEPGRLRFIKCETNIPPGVCDEPSTPVLPQDGVPQLFWHGIIPAKSSAFITYTAVVTDIHGIESDASIVNVATARELSGIVGITSSQAITLQSRSNASVDGTLFLPVVALSSSPPPPFPSLLSGGFENGPESGWLQSSDGNPSLLFIVHNSDSALGSVRAYEGEWLAWLGGIQLTTEYTLTQHVSTVIKDINLPFAERVGSRELDCTADKAYLYINSVEAYSRELCQEKNSDWNVIAPISLTKFLSDTTDLKVEFVVRLNSQDDLDDNSNWFLDSVIICNGAPTASDDVACPPQQQGQPTTVNRSVRP